MKVRYYIDPATGQPHIYNHDVAESEVEEVLDRPGEDRAGSDGSRVAIGRTRAGRLLRVIYVADPEPKSVFVITAYDLRGKPALAYRRRRRNIRP
jgi:CBS domain-containing protein